MWKLITVVIAKLLIVILRLFKRHATALPGLVAERLHPHLLSKMIKDVEGGVIIVTGTNGKTTTAKLLRKILTQQGQRVLANASGSNFTRGILASLIDHASWSGRLNYDIAVLEVDEAYTPLIAAETNPRTITVLNVMRDQLDRYGEIDNTVAMIGKALAYSEGLVFNLDDHPLGVLNSFVKKTTTFGVAPGIHQLLPSDDELHAEQIEQTPAKRPADVRLLAFKRQPKQTQLTIETQGGKYELITMLEGVHNYLNITAALATLVHLQGDLDESAIAAVAATKPAFGRGERMEVGGTPVHLALIKNPAGFNQNIRSFMTQRVGGVLFIINDRYADGRDVSWLWDVDLSSLAKQTELKLFCSGVRAYDMALRLQHEELEVEVVEPRIGRALKGALQSMPKDKELLILPTYTAMLETRRLILKKQKTRP